MVSMICAMLSTYADPTLSKPSDANLVGHVLDQNTWEHLPFDNILLKCTTIGATTVLSAHYFLKGLPLGTYTVDVSLSGFHT